MILDILLILLGFIFLILGADILVKGASAIAKRFKIPEIIIGLTIVCIGTSMPELIITIRSAMKGYTDIIVGNAVGSNLCNLLLILGLISIIKPIVLEKQILRIHLPIAIFSTLLVFFLGNTALLSAPYTLGFAEGIILLVLFLLYFSYPITIALKDILKTEEREKQQHTHPKTSILFSMMLILLGVILLKYGGDFVVDYSVKIAEMLGMSEHIIGLTIIAIGTALPELVTSLIAVIKKDSDLAVGNLIGSCMLNLWLILGVGSLITPLHFAADLNVSLLLLLFSTILIFCFGLMKKRGVLVRYQGILLVILYLCYFIYLFQT